MAACIFCGVGRKETEAAVIYEDSKTMAFLDTHPLAEGHALVVPKQHYADIFDIDEGVLQRAVLVAKKIADRMRSVLGADGVNILHASGQGAEQSVFHFHIHIIPRKKGDHLDFNAWWSTKVGSASSTELGGIAARLSMK